MELKQIYIFIFKHIRTTFNRTLWNWNYNLTLLAAKISNLLIVPYGIETLSLFNWCKRRNTLLIVPYGIETKFNSTFVVCPCALLIVPYGIETAHRHHGSRPPSPFNRTLWNWNPQKNLLEGYGIKLLIVPYGIETVKQRRGRSTPPCF